MNELTLLSALALPIAALNVYLVVVDLIAPIRLFSIDVASVSARHFIGARSTKLTIDSKYLITIPIEFDIRVGHLLTLVQRHTRRWNPNGSVLAVVNHSTGQVHVHHKWVPVCHCIYMAGIAMIIATFATLSFPHDWDILSRLWLAIILFAAATSQLLHSQLTLRAVVQDVCDPEFEPIAKKEKQKFHVTLFMDS